MCGNIASALISGATAKTNLFLKGTKRHEKIHCNPDGSTFGRFGYVYNRYGRQYR